ncbi:hypothetical protein D0B32_26105 [Paraburkholderia sp. DHOC27]|nr:hypothetical protein D0B32_26105 [Paraburkholderia sp. DHOC27]
MPPVMLRRGARRHKCTQAHPSASGRAVPPPVAHARLRSCAFSGGWRARAAIREIALNARPGL